MMMMRMEIGREVWRVIGIYVNGDWRQKIERMRKWMEVGGKERVIVGGDFNARTGELEGRGRWGEGDGEEESIKSKDKGINRKRKKLVEDLEKLGLMIFNEETEGDKNGEYTYTKGRGNTVIVYVVGGRGGEGKGKVDEGGGQGEVGPSSAGGLHRGGKGRKERKEE